MGIIKEILREVLHRKKILTRIRRWYKSKGTRGNSSMWQ